MEMEVTFPTFQEFSDQINDKIFYQDDMDIQKKTAIKAGFSSWMELNGLLREKKNEENKNLS